MHALNFPSIPQCTTSSRTHSKCCFHPLHSVRAGKACRNSQDKLNEPYAGEAIPETSPLSERPSIQEFFEPYISSCVHANRTLLLNILPALLHPVAHPSSLPVKSEIPWTLA
ncbi:hypothetical protein AVEN_200453-1 [Araneus ventricosus]|uniref:Uncharacterized protein n=1 Tax=Araneus ventricosus TaxID=182803 RepID=A0A4Y2JIX6_ARAVE|nr:hypothetical protein AVEN_200453-1 [Araneus ventricosus]